MDYHGGVMEMVERETAGPSIKSILFSCVEGAWNQYRTNQKSRQ
jgi:hypothetical protein